MHVIPRRLFALLLILISLLVSCAPTAAVLQEPMTSQRTDWQPADLRLLDPIDSTSPEFELIAAYLRLNEADLQVRLDLLDYKDPFSFDLFVALDFLPGNGTVLPVETGNDFGWDVLFVAPAGHDPYTVYRDGLSLPAVLPRVVRDSALDSAVFSIPRQLFSGRRQITAVAWTSPPDEATVADFLGPFGLEDAAPARAPLLLEFSNVLPARTPAQLLRRWDGAHTGPYGQRHGLRYLLTAAQKQNIPIILLDLAQPQSLRGLSLVGGLNTLRMLVNRELVTLPDAGYGTPEFAPEIAAYHQEFASQMGLPSGRVSLGYSPRMAEQPRMILEFLRDSSHIQQASGVRFIPMLAAAQAGSQDAIDKDGLTLETRQRLLEAALSSDPTDLVVLGGSLPESPWGDLTVVDETMQYIAGHPWIQPLSTSDLQAFPVLEKADISEILACPNVPLCQAAESSVLVATPYGMPAANQITSTDLARQISQRLTELPSDPFADSAREMFAALTQPQSDSRIARLAASALTQAGYLIEASRWNQQPTSQAQCNTDLDWDGYPECVLSDPEFFCVLDPEGGRLAFAAVRSAGQAHQLIGPTLQNAAGLSSSVAESEDVETLANSTEILGAFADPGANWSVYTATPGERQIVLQDDRRAITRTFSLEAGKLIVSIHNDPTPHRMPVFLAMLAGVSPAHRPTQFSLSSDSVCWSLTSDSIIEIHLQNAGFTETAGVLDALPLLDQSEDPDQAYPSGHYLPFPFLILDLSAEKDFTATISVN